MDSKQFNRNVATYIQASTNELDRLRASERSLLDKVASLESANVRIQKEASQQTTAICQPEEAANLADNIVRAGLMKEAEREAFIYNCLNNPNTLVGFMDKLAAITINSKGLPVLGSGVERGTTAALQGNSKSDDAWDSFMSTLNRKIN